MTDLVPFATPSNELVALARKAREYVASGVPHNTERAYRSDWSRFEAWCASHGLQALPAAPATVVLYLTDRADALKVSTLTRRLATISQAHKTAGFDTPTGKTEVRAVMKSIRRGKGTARAAKAPVQIVDLRGMVAALPNTLLGARDRALLLLGFAGGFRRSELVGLDVADLAFNSEGVTATLRRSKTDQEAAGRKVGIPLGQHAATCPVTALRSWLEAAAITEGPVFRRVTRGGKAGDKELSDQSVALAVKRAAKAVGLDPAAYSGHSLRAGLATSAAAAGASERSIARQTGHRSMVVLRGYIRDGSLYLDNAAVAAGL